MAVRFARRFNYLMGAVRPPCGFKGEGKYRQAMNAHTRHLTLALILALVLLLVATVVARTML